jgi:glycosyltransferase involved in cell wall biosynthesis
VINKTRINSEGKDSALFIMPRSSKAWLGAEALWITVAGWSAAAKRKLGHAWVITSDRIAAPEEVIHYPLVKKEQTVKSPGGRHKWIPQFFKLVVKDILMWRKSKDWSILSQEVWKQHRIAFVWEQHDLFPGPGRKLADQLGVPLVTYVHAPVIWEASKWNVKRYLWGCFLETFIEARSLKRSDVVACVSEEVVQKLIKLGVARERIVVSPMAVDQHLFEGMSGNQIRKDFGLEGKKIIGWTGSFRSFHGLDLLVRAFALIHSEKPETVLMLVGDGSERESLQELVAELGIATAVVFTGRQAFARIPEYVATFDIAVVSARSAVGFHYSPLKLREYLAAGKVVLAPDAGEIPAIFKDDLHLKLYKAGDVSELTQRMHELINDPKKKERLATAGKIYVLKSGTWDHELGKLIN